MALMRKGGTARLADYFGALLSKPLVFGLGWDVARGSSIDLDASAIMMDAAMEFPPAKPPPTLVVLCSFAVPISHIYPPTRLPVECSRCSLL